MTAIWFGDLLGYYSVHLKEYFSYYASCEIMLFQL